MDYFYVLTYIDRSVAIMYSCAFQIIVSRALVDLSKPEDGITTNKSLGY